MQTRDIKIQHQLFSFFKSKNRQKQIYSCHAMDFLVADRPSFYQVDKDVYAREETSEHQDIV